MDQWLVKTKDFVQPDRLTVAGFFIGRIISKSAADPGVLFVGLER